MNILDAVVVKSVCESIVSLHDGDAKILLQVPRGEMDGSATSISV